MSKYLEKVGIKNFKSFRDYTEISFSDITIISGLNSSGKSSIYQSIFALAQSSNSYTYFKDENENNNRLLKLELNGEIINLGIGEELLNDINNKIFEISLFWHDNTRIDLKFKLYTKKLYKQKNDFIIYESTINGQNDVFYSVKCNNFKWSLEARSSLSFINSSIVSIIEKHIESQMKENDIDISKEIAKNYLNGTIEFKEIYSVIFDGYILDNFEIDISDLKICIDEKYHDCVNFDLLEKEILPHNGNNRRIKIEYAYRFLNHKYNINSEDITYLPPFRGFPKRIYSFSDPERLDVDTFLTQVNIPYIYDFSNASSKLGTLKEAINYWIVNHFNLADEVILREPIPDVVSEIFLRYGDKEVPINNVGFGTSQIIPIVYELLSNRNYMFFVDEPEIHLHPSAQSKLADFFFHMALLGKKIFIETHSEYIIDKFIYLVISDNIFLPKTKMLWVKKSVNGTYIEEIKYDDLGFIENSPEGFLSEKRELVEKINKLRLAKF